MTDIAVTAVVNSIRVHFGETLHLHLDREKLSGLQSWVMSGGGRFCIEYTFDGGASLLTEYDDADKFRAVLSGLEKVL